jgi:hypothetical protein
MRRKINHLYQMSFISSFPANALNAPGFMKSPNVRLFARLTAVCLILTM